MKMNVYSAAFTNTGESRWTHQLQVSPHMVSGEAANASMSATAISSGACQRASTSFPSQRLIKDQTIGGEAAFQATAAAIDPGRSGTCTTTWAGVITNPGFPNQTTPSYVGLQVRCDNNTGGRTVAGCVFPQYASGLVYRESVVPSIVKHVTWAQASGLPGGTFERPLHRETNETNIRRNRSLACSGYTPPGGENCDEYPVATSSDGLAAGGTKRTHRDCNVFPNPPRTGVTDPKGVSVCMRPARQQSSQGGTNTQFYRDQRVLQGDPFRIVTGP